jgi:hypothetical protein
MERRLKSETGSLDRAGRLALDFRVIRVFRGSFLKPQPRKARKTRKVPPVVDAPVLAGDGVDGRNQFETAT